MFKGRRLAKKSSRPGVTTELDFYNIDNKVVFVDTPGYGINLNRRARNRWEYMVKQYLRESPNLRMVCLLMDVTLFPSDDDVSLVKLIQSRTKGRIETSSRSVESSENKDTCDSSKSYDLEGISNDNQPSSHRELIQQQQLRIQDIMMRVKQRQKDAQAGFTTTPNGTAEGLTMKTQLDNCVLETVENREGTQPSIMTNMVIKREKGFIGQEEGEQATVNHLGASEASEDVVGVIKFTETVDEVPILLILTKDDKCTHDQRYHRLSSSFPSLVRVTHSPFNR